MGRMTLGLRGLAALAVAALLQGCATAPSSEWVFTGLVDSGAKLPITTIFITEAQGITSGRYVFTEPGNIAVPGTLSRCTSLGAQQLRCEWRDRYGRGLLHVTFAQDQRSFDGHWQVGEEPGKGPEYLLGWNGAR